MPHRICISINRPRVDKFLDTAAVCNRIVSSFVGAMVTEEDAFEIERLRMEATVKRHAQERVPIYFSDVVRGSFENRVRAFGKKKRLTIPLPGGNDLSGFVSEAFIIFETNAPVEDSTVQAFIEFLRSIDEGDLTVTERFTDKNSNSVD